MEKLCIGRLQKSTQCLRGAVMDDDVKDGFIDELEDRITELQETGEVKDTCIDKLKDRIIELEEKNVELKKTVTEANNELASLNQLTSDLRRQLASMSWSRFTGL